MDLLKKGTSALAQRARAASRILEAQVGTNPRIRVQRDDAFVLWDEIPFDEQTSGTQGTTPEWVRRTICCARWELEHVAEELFQGQSAVGREVRINGEPFQVVGVYKMADNPFAAAMKDWAIVPTTSALGFQKGYLGADGERAAIEGELQVKGSTAGRWGRVCVRPCTSVCTS